MTAEINIELFTWFKAEPILEYRETYISGEYQKNETINELIIIENTIIIWHNWIF